jgi:hypothetical protein
MYADATKLTACSDDLNNLKTVLNSDLNNIHQWIVPNKLTLNVDKTGGENLKRSRDNGIITENESRWDEQIDNICIK